MLSDERLREIQASGNPILLRNLSPEDKDRLNALQGKGPPPVPVEFLPTPDDAPPPARPDGSALDLIPSLADVDPRSVKDFSGPSTSDLAALPGTIAVGLMEGIRAGGVEDAGGMISGLLNFGFKAMNPMSDEAKVAGKGISYLLRDLGSSATSLIPGGEPARMPNTAKAVGRFALDEFEFFRKFSEDPVKVAREEPLRALDALTMISVPTAVGLKRGMVALEAAGDIGKFNAASIEIAQGVGEKMSAKITAAKAKGVTMTEAEALEEVIASDKSLQVLRRAKGWTGPMPGPTPMPHGNELKWIREAGEKKGSRGWAEHRVARNQADHTQRLSTQQHRAAYSTLSADAKAGIESVALGTDIVGGKIRHGGMLRAGQMKIPRNKEQLASLMTDLGYEDDFVEAFVAQKGRARELFAELDVIGRVDGGGRVVGPPIGNGRDFQLYRVIKADDAEKTYKAFLEKHPEAEKTLMEFLAEKEVPVVTRNGTILPGLSRKRLQEQYKIKGGFGSPDTEEARIASSLIRQAFGKDAFPTDQMWQFNWVPEVPLKSTGILSRYRNGLASFRSKSRLGKTGKAAEAKRITEGGAPDFDKRLLKSRLELATEEIHNDMVRGVLTQVGEKLSIEDIRHLEKTGGVGRLPGYEVVAPSGMFGASAKMRGFLRKNQEWFKANGIDVPNAIDATYLTGGGGIKVPEGIAGDLGAFFADTPTLSPGRETFNKAMAAMVAIPQISWLSRPSTANRNFFSQAVTFAPKMMRDFYRQIFDPMPALRYEELPFNDLLSDFAAIRKMHSRGLRGQMPPEMMGSTFLMELEGQSGLTTALAKPLRLFGFNYHDVSFKRLVTESVLDAQSKAAYHRAKRFGQVNTSKTEWMRRWRAGVPKEVEQLAWREMDTWGAFDYDNVPEYIRGLKRSTVGRSAVPYPTYFYKLIANTYGELGYTPQGFYRNAAAIFGKGSTKAERVNGMANLAAGATMGAIAYMMTDSVGNLAMELEDEEMQSLVNLAQELTGDRIGEGDLPFETRQFGRQTLVPGALEELAGLEEDEALWVRTYDVPFIGEMQAARAIFGKDYDLSQFLNDRVALGPLVTAISVLTGMSDDYNKNYSQPSRAGKLMADMTPFTNEAKLMRRLDDPKKREITRPGAPAWEDFLAGFANNYPVLSSFLPEETDIGKDFPGDLTGILRPKLSQKGGELSVPHYNKMETLGAHFLLNWRAISEEERSAAISAVAVQMLTEHSGELSEDMLLTHTLNIMNAETGETEFGEARKKARASDENVKIQLRSLRNAIFIKRAFNDGGLDAAIEAAEVWTKDAGSISEINSARSLLKRLGDMEAGGVRDYLLRPESRHMRGRILDELEAGE